METKLVSNDIRNVLGTLSSYPIVIRLSLIFMYVLYSRYNTPLRHVPGPFWSSITRLSKVRLVKSGNQPQGMVGLHQKYGTLVRVGPNEVSVSDPYAVKQISGVGTNFRKSAWYPAWHMSRAPTNEIYFLMLTAKGTRRTKEW